MNFKASGIAGSLRVGGREAAALGKWVFTPRGDGWTVTAAVAERDEHWLTSGHPFELRLQLAKETWRFRDVQATVTAVAATITGTTPPEES